MKKIYLIFFPALLITHNVFSQTTTLTVDANDVLNANTKIVAATSAGQSFFTGHQVGGTYSFGGGIFRAVTDNPNGAYNYYFDGITNGTTNFFVKADGLGYFANRIGIGLGITSPSALLTVNGQVSSGSTTSLGTPTIADFSGGNFDRARIAIGNTTGPSSSIIFYGKSSGSTLENKWEVGSNLSGNDNDLYFFSNSLSNVPFYLGAGGNVGVSNSSPISRFQVEAGCTKASIGEADGLALNYGTSYLGFNAARSAGNWNVSTDNLHNGGGVIYGGIDGSIYFAPIASTVSGNNTDQTLSDADVKSRIAFRIGSDGVTYTKKVVVELTGWPDYVFKSTYNLKSLAEVKTFIDQNHHLPDMPSEKEIADKGLDLGKMNKLLAKKVEELTLYLIEKEKQLKEQADKTDRLEKKLEAIINANGLKQ